MSSKIIPPALGLESFSCPHCGAIAHQYWHETFISKYDDDKKPTPLASAALIASSFKNNSETPHPPEIIEHFTSLAAGEIVPVTHGKGTYLNHELKNLSISRCFSCKRFAVWKGDTLIYPSVVHSVEAHPDMPDDVRNDFLEAAAIVDLSTRGAAALLRLSIQKLMPHVGQKGKNLDDDIGNLVKNGLDVGIQQALDFVRVIGNHAVHPGEIHLEDDKPTAAKLFGIVNEIIDRLIAYPKRMQEHFGSLPVGALKAIADRDKKP